MTIRRFCTADTARLCEIFYRSIHEVACARYTGAQLDAWAPAIPDPQRWQPWLAQFTTFVADSDTGETVAWIAMTEAGYIDMLFRLPEAAGRGIASALYDAAEREARRAGLTRLTVHASLLAQPFFAKHGWLVETHETVVRNGVPLPRAAMAKELAPARREQGSAVSAPNA